MGGAEGPVELRLHAAAGRAGRRRQGRRAAGARRRGRAGTGRRAGGTGHVGGIEHLGRSGRAGRRAVGAGVERGERERPGVPRGGPLPERRHLLRRGGPQPGPAGRRRGGEPAPLRARPRHGGRAAPGARAGVIDEAHQLEDIVSATSGIELTGGRFADLARRVRGVIADDRLPAGVDDAGRLITEALRPHRDRRLKGALPDDLAGAITVARGRVESALTAARNVPGDAPEETRARALRLTQTAGALVEDLGAVEQVTADEVVWVEGTDANPMLRVAPLDVAGLLQDALWSRRTCVLTSATLPARLPSRLGVAAAQITELDVGSPFDYEAHALLYCAAHLPDPRQPAYLAALTDELGDLIEAAGGRTLALFTSFRVLDEAAAALQLRLDVPVLTQRDLPKGRLLELFADDEATCLFATMGFWQGVDVPGASLSLVTIDRIPFPRPDEPLLQARRERAGADAFGLIDLPRAATLLAQGAGRLIRSADDRGVVAVLDPRLATAGYRWDMVQALPPMRRTKDPAEVRRTLEAIRDGRT